MAEEQRGEAEELTGVAALVVTRRLELGLGPTELNRLAGLSEGHVSKIESGQYELPSDKTIDKLNKVLRLTREDFYRAAGRYGHGKSQRPPPELDAGLMIADFNEILELAQRIVSIAQRSSRKRVVKMPKRKAG